ncbi:MAG: hypothetical protein EZS28_002648 [Streblomastix strix]|uniref:t-SNARE coiled-coil homology domain-containing protein n=1 Tax=Streblomastix strix TaxID=222440 RepID=A0A5J4X507_9EUKA|nr:MAG: hypothetical protein EZS28_002648 [Streblomastix strix]
MDLTSVFCDACSGVKSTDSTIVTIKPQPPDDILRITTSIFCEIAERRLLIIAHAASFVNIYSFPVTQIAPMEDAERDLFASECKSFFRRCQDRIDTLHKDILEHAQDNKWWININIFKSNELKKTEAERSANRAQFFLNVVKVLYGILGETIKALDLLIKAHSYVQRKRTAAQQLQSLVRMGGEEKKTVALNQRLADREKERGFQGRDQGYQKRNTDLFDETEQFEHSSGNLSSAQHLRLENKQLEHDLLEQYDTVKQIERNAQEIAEMSEAINQKIVQQDEDIQLIKQLTDQSIDIVKDGTRYLQRAAKRWGIRRWIAYIVIILTITLLVAEFIR